jgi:hypothetical protein
VRIIFDWKTGGRGRSRLERNQPSEIREALEIATKARSARIAIGVLASLQGIEIPVASAILTMVDPTRFTIIDFRTLHALGIRSQKASVDLYLGYLHYCRSLARKWKIDLRTLDRALWQWSSAAS